MTDDQKETKPDGSSAAEAAEGLPEEKTALSPPAVPAPEPAVPAAESGPEKGGGESPDKTSPRKPRKHDHDAVRSLKDRLERREHEIERLDREIAEIKDKYLRAAAEMDNTRKRLEREKSDFLLFAQADLFKELLAVLDNFERALRTGEEPEGKGGFQEGIELIHKQLTDLLRKRGVTPVERPDRRFDPAVHQAIVTEEKEGLTEAEVGEELQKGYFFHDRLLRPALVKVWLPKKD
ncbi:MAG: nucleotide exchange factor GrpE [Candidatus Aminicenantales bacterium]|jgi:molecular chaperone GrpE